MTQFRTTNEVARMLAVSDRTVLNLIRQGSLQAVRVGRQWRVPDEALSAYLRSPHASAPAASGTKPPR